jgi:hypothetical protein
MNRAVERFNDETAETRAPKVLRQRIPAHEAALNITALVFGGREASAMNAGLCRRPPCALNFSNENRPRLKRISSGFQTTMG